jgi:hypothetical protein
VTLYTTEPAPFEYTARQVFDGIAVLAVTAVGLIGASLLLLGAWGW